MKRTQSFVTVFRDACLMCSKNDFGVRHGVQVDDPTRKVVDRVFLSDIVECEILEIEDKSHELEVVIRTTEEGYSAGRSYIYKSERQDALDWEAAVDDAVDAAKRLQRKQQMHAEFGHSRVEMKKAQCRDLLASFQVQAAVALVISLAFLVDMLEAQYLPAQGTAWGSFFFAFDFLVSLLFLVELIFNLFAFSNEGLRHYFMDWSHCLDAAIVVVSLASVATYLLEIGDVGYIKMFRLIRVLRVLRFSLSHSSFQAASSPPRCEPHKDASTRVR